MEIDTSKRRDWQKYLIYFNLALAVLTSSKVDAQNFETNAPQSSKPKITLASLKMQNGIKVVDGSSPESRLSPEEKEQIRQNIIETGMDIRYDKDKDKFILRQDGTYNDVYNLRNSDYDKSMQMWQDWHDTLYAKPSKICSNHLTRTLVI